MGSSCIREPRGSSSSVKETTRYNHVYLEPNWLKNICFHPSWWRKGGEPPWHHSNVHLSSSGVLCLCSLRRLQPGLLHDFGSKQPAQLVEVQALPSSSPSSSLTNTGSQNSPSMSCQHSQPFEAGAASSCSSRAWNPVTCPWPQISH